MGLNLECRSFILKVQTDAYRDPRWELQVWHCSSGPLPSLSFQLETTVSAQYRSATVCCSAWESEAFLELRKGEPGCWPAYKTRAALPGTAPLSYNTKGATPEWPACLETNNRHVPGCPQQLCTVLPPCQSLLPGAEAAEGQNALPWCLAELAGCFTNSIPAHVGKDNVKPCSTPLWGETLLKNHQIPSSTC